jgi:hypothetical protein
MNFMDHLNLFKYEDEDQIIETFNLSALSDKILINLIIKGNIKR